jgi:hypothetical protein
MSMSMFPYPLRGILLMKWGSLFNSSSCALQPYFVFQDSVERFISYLERKGRPLGVSLGRNEERGEKRGRYRGGPVSMLRLQFHG